MIILCTEILDIPDIIINPLVHHVHIPNAKTGVSKYTDMYAF